MINIDYIDLPEEIINKLIYKLYIYIYIYIYYEKKMLRKCRD